MNRRADTPPAYVGRRRTEQSLNVPPPPGQTALVSMAGAIGAILMGIQLWLLTVALDLFLGGRGDQVWQLALVSGAIFLGGLLMLALLRRRPRVR